MGRLLMFYKFCSLILLGIVIIASGCDNITDPEVVPDPTIPSDYQLIWSDEFDQETQFPNNQYWNYDIGYGENGWGNDEWQLYTNETENVRVESGNLVISAIWDSTAYDSPGKRDGSITSARINTMNKFSVRYGKIQARIKPPSGAGMWPAFWMLGSSFDTIGWPYCGEIDIMEMSPLYHDDKTSLCTIHWWDDINENKADYGTNIQLNESLSADYHIFEVEWDEERIVGRIDNIAYFVKTIDPSTMDEFLRDFFLVFNVAVGGNLGGPPDDSTEWPQNMYVDWVRVYQADNSPSEISRFGIFTDETEVDAALEIGVDSEIYVWENTLAAAAIPPFEGDNVIAWSTTGQAWFGGGIQSTVPKDLSNFVNGYLKFRIQIPATVTFKIGINDIEGQENYVEFPANQTKYGLERNGEWGQALIPISELSGDVDLEMMSYEFIILGEDGSQCQFALDDIYYDGGGLAASSVAFDSNSYAVEATSATIFVDDEAAADSTVTVEVDNSIEVINIAVDLDTSGSGNTTFYFGPTNDATNTIDISETSQIIASYTDANGFMKTDTASIETASANAAGIYSESHTETVFVYQQIVNSADWSGNGAAPDEESTAVTPVDGSFVLGVDFTDLGGSWGGIAFDYTATTPDISTYETLNFYVNSVSMPIMQKLGVKFEDNLGGETEVNIADYTPEYSGQWAKYEIPLSDFNAVDLSQIKYLLFVNPSDSSGNYLFGNLYFDDIYLEKQR